MAKIQNSEITQRAIRDLKLDPLREAMPGAASDKIVLTYNLNFPNDGRIIFDAVRTATSSNFTVHTVAARKITYLTGIFFSVNSDATADNTTYHVEITDEVTGEERRLLQFFKATTSAIRDQVFLTFPAPIRLLPGSTVQLTNVFSVGTSSVVISGHGYTKDL